MATNPDKMLVQNVPKMGPKPTLLSRKEIDVLYETLQDVLQAFAELHVDAIVTGGSLLGAIRQHSILFCDDDIDLSIIDYDHAIYDTIVRPRLQEVLGEKYLYRVKPWDGGDRIRPRRMSNIFLDLFVLRKFETLEDLKKVIGIKKNGQPQSDAYVTGIIEKMTASAGYSGPLCPFWHFNTRKAIEMWTKEVYWEEELFPLDRSLKMGPITGIRGPRMPVKLLKRAFGNDCFDVYFQSISHQSGPRPTSRHHQQAKSSSKSDLPPMISAGGTWEGGVKTKLDEEHYIPIQPILKTARRPTLHNKDQLQRYLVEQSNLEEQWTRECIGMSQGATSAKKRTVYMDGVFDLFHIGHLEAIRQCKQQGNWVIIGVTGDQDATCYKRQPIVPEKERCAIVEALAQVDEVICPCPLVVTEEFMSRHGIDLVVHGFANDADAQRQAEFFEVPMRTGRFQRIAYYSGMSTTDRIRNIQKLLEDNAPSQISEGQSGSKPQWFGRSLSNATRCSREIPFDPFPIELRQVAEPHIAKAREKREAALDAVRLGSGNGDHDDTLAEFKSQLARERDFEFDTSTYKLREALIQDLALDKDFDLSTIHEVDGRKEQILYALTMHFDNFQNTYDEFVRRVCAPHAAKLFPCSEIYYQAFPCLRIVQPDEFSIGPHADVAYGHHPCSVNFYVPLTQVRGAASLFLESRLGAEDWHPIQGSYGVVKQFAGALCMHWTTENKANYTRVSIDFRLIPGPLFHSIKSGDDVEGGQKDPYRASEGYYSVCCEEVIDTGEVVWERRSPLIAPDARVGFPWTIKDWKAFWSKEDKKYK